MAREKFEDWTPGKAAQRDVMRCNQILEEYRQQGFTLTLRQVFYQCVSRDYIPNNILSYRRLGSILNKARMAGLVDWSMIEDRGRTYVLPSHWEDPASVIDSAAYGFRIDKWRDQPCHVEVMVEKDALSGVLAPTCRRLDIGYTANRGYSSASAMYEASQRMKRAHNANKTIHVLYLGDHDPSGMDMARDVIDRLQLFLGFEFIDEGERYRNEDIDDDAFDVDRLALNMDQIESYAPPENPARTTDPRSRTYIDLFGSSSWELDALNPTVLADLVTNAVEDLRDEALWGEAVAKEEGMRAELRGFARNYRETHS